VFKKEVEKIKMLSSSQANNRLLEKRKQEWKKQT